MGLEGKPSLKIISESIASWYCGLVFVYIRNMLQFLCRFCTRWKSRGNL